MKNILLIPIFAIVILACELLDDNEYYYIDKKLNEISTFPLGTYWIYFNDSLNVFDTITVIEYKKSMYEEHMDSIMQYYEEIRTKSRRSYRKSIIDEYISAIYFDGYERKETMTVENDTLEKYLFSLYIQSDTIKMYSAKEITFIEKSRYKNVLHIKCESDEYSNKLGTHRKFISEYNFVSGVGIIEYTENVDGSNIKWELVDYTIK